MFALLAPVVVQTAQATFAPPLDRPIAYTVREVREDGTRTQQFAIRRRVTFRAAPDGFIAEVETAEVTSDAGGAGALFQAIARRALGKRIVLRLDRGGRTVDVDDFDAVWDTHMAALNDVLVTKNPSLAPLVETLLAPARALPRAAKVTRIGEIVAPLIADHGIVAGPSRPVKVAAREPNGRSTELTGTEQVSVEADRQLLLERSASGTVAGAPMTVSLRRRIDPRTGLIAETVSVETIEHASARLIVTRSTRIVD